MFRVTIIRMIVTRCGKLCIPSVMISMENSRDRYFLVSDKRVTRRVFNVFSFFVNVRFRLIGTYGAGRNRLTILIRANFYFRLSIGRVKRRKRSRDLRRGLRMKLTYKRRVDNTLPRVTYSTRQSFQYTSNNFRHLLIQVSILRTRIRSKARNSKTINKRNTHVGYGLTCRINVSGACQSSKYALDNGIISIKSFSTVRVGTIFKEEATPGGRIITVTSKERESTKVKTCSTQGVPINSKAFLCFLRTSSARTSQTFSASPRKEERRRCYIRRVNVLFRLCLSRQN